MSGYMHNGAFGVPERSAARWRGSSCNRPGNRDGWKGRQNHQDDQQQNQSPEDLVDPCKVFVSNLRPRVTEQIQQYVMPLYAAVQKPIIIEDKHTKRSKGNGVVKVRTQENVNKLLALRDSDRFIEGQQVVIHLAKEEISLPGDEGYVRRPLSDRDFDLVEPDPTKPSIHMLVDDVILKIFSYLPIRNLVRCEGVCRRWQMLVHRHFSKLTSLEMNKDLLEIPPPFTKAIISKFLILSGPNLKSLKVQEVDFATQQNILKIISQLCPMLEHLDVTKAKEINFLQISELAQGCKNIKSFIAKNCFDFDEKALHQVLLSFPQLERLNLDGTSVNGENFNFLPSTLKELNIERTTLFLGRKITQMTQMDDNPITQIADNCPNLEILEMRQCILSKKDLEYFGKNCHNLTKLSMYMSSTDDTEAFSTFKKLKDLLLLCGSVDLTLLFSILPQMESLAVYAVDTVSKEVDFSVLKNLKCLKLQMPALSMESLLTLANCKQFEELHLYKFYSLPEDVLLGILKGCSKLQQMVCPDFEVCPTFITKVDQIMKERHIKLVIRACDPSPIIDFYENPFHDVQYDRNKIKFDFTSSFSYLDDLDRDNQCDYDPGDLIDSDDSYDVKWCNTDDYPANYYHSDCEPPKFEYDSDGYLI